MIEKINTEGYETISKPSENVITYLEKLLSDNEKPITVAEIGVGVGATSVEIVKRLRECDSFYFFSYDWEVEELNDDLKDADWCKCKLYPVGNSTKTYDSYNWPLSKLCLEGNVSFDLAYLDGGHTLFCSGLGAVLLKKLIKPEGILIFDDVFWTQQHLDPSVHDKVLEGYTLEQFETPQIKMVIDLFMEDDEDWERQGDIEWQTVYKKK